MIQKYNFIFLQAVQDVYQDANSDPPVDVKFRDGVDWTFFATSEITFKATDVDGWTVAKVSRKVSTSISLEMTV